MALNPNPNFKQTSKNTCFNCGKEGHWSNACTAPRKARGGGTSSSMKCYGCGEAGHFASRCPQKLGWEARAEQEEVTKALPAKNNNDEKIADYRKENNSRDRSASPSARKQAPIGTRPAELRINAFSSLATAGDDSFFS